MGGRWCLEYEGKGEADDQIMRMMGSDWIRDVFGRVWVYVEGSIMVV